MLSIYAVLTLPLLARVVSAQTPITAPFSPPDAASALLSSNSSTIPNQHWSNLLGNLLWFYDAQRSGALGSANRVPWRNDSALSDGSDVNMDLTGGFYDAGDYIKATYPFTFTLANVAWGAIDFANGYDLSNQTPYLDRTLRWGLDWLIKAHPQPSVLCVQVGDTNIDNNYWGGDQGIPQPRPSYFINTTAPGTDAAASAAAAFAAASVLYRGSPSLANSAWSGGSSLNDTTFADSLLTHAKDLYTFATTADQIEYSKSVPAMAEAYASSGFEDNLVWAAIWLYLATNTSTFLDTADSIYASSNLKGSNDVFNWDSTVPGITVLMTQVLRSRGQNATLWQIEAERYFDRIVTGKKSSTSFMTPGGLLYYPGDSEDASLNPAANAAMLMLRYAPLATSTSKGDTYRTFALAQVDYFLGKNPMNRPYVVGVHPNSPSNPHSAMASGGNDINHINTVPPTEANVLYGAVVGGPGKGDEYYDERDYWKQSEVALDYNAPFLSLAAYGVATNADDPAYVKIVGDPVAPKRKKGLSKGAIIAIVVVSVIVVATLVLVILWFFRRRRSKYI